MLSTLVAAQKVRSALVGRRQPRVACVQRNSEGETGLFWIAYLESTGLRANVATRLRTTIVVMLKISLNSQMPGVAQFGVKQYSVNILSSWINHSLLA